MHPIKKELTKRLPDKNVGDPHIFKLPNDVLFFCTPLVGVIPPAQYVTGFYSKKGGVTDMLVGTIYIGSIINNGYNIFIGFSSDHDGSFFKFVDNEWIPIAVIGGRKVI